MTTTHYVDSEGRPACGMPLATLQSIHAVTNPSAATCPNCVRHLMSPGRTVQLTLTVDQVNRMTDWLMDAIDDPEDRDATGEELRAVLLAAVGIDEDRGGCRFAWGRLGQRTNFCVLTMGHSGEHRSAEGAMPKPRRNVVHED